MSSRTKKDGTNEKKTTETTPSSGAHLDIGITMPRRGLRVRLVSRGRAAVVIATAIAGLLAALATSFEHGPNGALAPADVASASQAPSAK